VRAEISTSRDEAGSATPHGAPDAAPTHPSDPAVESSRHHREQIDRARSKLDALEGAYRRAIERGLAADSLAGIDAEFDEADRLQSRLLVWVQRPRALERESPANGCEPAPARSADRTRGQRADGHGMLGAHTLVPDAA